MKSFRYYVTISLVIPILMDCQSLSKALAPVTEILLPDEDEVELGNKLKKQILADTVNYPRYKKSPDVINYIETMGQRIAAAQKDRDITKVPFSFTIINDTMINAFALPGGHVFVYTGLLKAAKNGAEVAGVLAHEVGHIGKRHSANRIVQASGISLVNQIIFGDDSSAGAAIAGLLENMVFLKFSRDDEFQADSCAVAYSIAAKYNPNGITGFFETLKAKYGDDGPFEVFSTHPKTGDRISHAKDIVSKSGKSVSDTTKSYTTEYTAIKSKI